MRTHRPTAFQDQDVNRIWPRRLLLQAGVMGMVGLTLRQPRARATPSGAMLMPTPACRGKDEQPTPRQTAGPFYTPDTPERTTLIDPGIRGTQLLIMGKVLTTQCQPIANALLDFWQADANGHYDHEGYILRGHQFTDQDANFRLLTVVPGNYPGRTRHLHVKVQVPHGRILTTQLYFPNEPQNRRDGLFNSKLVMRVSQITAEQLRAQFHFVLKV
ncbi:hypothetical protein NKDENANG_01039 [Candidatus Entotheonellaceae bacterium PAL068K]